MLTLEVLEGRAVPAALVNQFGGFLAITGDPLAQNNIRVDAGSAPGQVVATVNGQPQTFSGVTNLLLVGGFNSDDINNTTALPSVISGNGGGDTIFGGRGTDRIFAQGGGNVVYDLLGVNAIVSRGGGDADRVYTNAQSQALTDVDDLLVNFFAAGRTPGAGALSLEQGVLYIAPSNAGTRTLINQVGDQVVVTYDFGQGLQQASFDAAKVKAIAYFGGAGDDVYVNNTSIEEAAYGSAGDDVILSGTGAFNLLKGSGGNDVIFARGQRTDLSGDGGADIIFSPGAQTNTVRGADALDAVFISGAARVV